MEKTRSYVRQPWDNYLRYDTEIPKFHWTGYVPNWKRKVTQIPLSFLTKTELWRIRSRPSFMKVYFSNRSS